MNIEVDKDLMWIAKEGFMAPIPEPWTQDINDNEEVFYLNKETKEISWTHPLDNKYKELYLREKAKLNRNNNNELGNNAEIKVSLENINNSFEIDEGTDFELDLNDGLINAYNDQIMVIQNNIQILEENYNEKNELLNQPDNTIEH